MDPSSSIPIFFSIWIALFAMLTKNYHIQAASFLLEVSIYGNG